jgi:hypothetical protein
MKRLTILVLLALVALSGVAGSRTAWAGGDEATGPTSIQTP